MMRIGNLRKRLELQRESLVPDGHGGSAASWSKVADVWGEITPLTGFGRFTVQYDRRLTHVIKIRYCPDIEVKTGMRLVEGSRIFAIRSVTNVDEDNRWLEILAEEGGVLG